MDLEISDVDKLVMATLAGAKAAAEKKESPGQYIQEYEKMVRVFVRRQKLKSDKANAPAGDAPQE